MKKGSPWWRARDDALLSISVFARGGRDRKIYGEGQAVPVDVAHLLDFRRASAMIPITAHLDTLNCIPELFSIQMILI